MRGKLSAKSAKVTAVSNGVITLCLAFVLLSCTSHIVHHKKGLSTETSYIHFGQTQKQFSHRGEVGGEFRRYYKLLAYSGERYKITVDRSSKFVRHHVSSSGKASIDQRRDETIVEIGPEDVIIEVLLYAHPQGMYELTIEILSE